jgi:hypothetical protein
MRDAISHTIFEARLKIDIKASFARGCSRRKVSERGSDMNRTIIKYVHCSNESSRTFS